MRKRVCFVLLFFIGLKMNTQSQNSDSCVTRYPVILVHGIGYRDDIKIYRYWGNIPAYLQKHGVQVFLAGQNAFNTHEKNAEQLKVRCENVLQITGAEKVNIIAHSKGGIESRYMITKLGMADKVASLTTIATPHRGSPLANYIIETIFKLKVDMLVINSLKTYAKILGDKNPEILKAGLQLTPQYMKQFNEKVPDMPQVYYQSYGGEISETYPRILQRKKYNLIKQHAGTSDGVVPVSSYKWGNFRGVVSSKTGIGVSHFEIVGQVNVAKFEVEQFFTSILCHLKQKDF